MRDNTIDYVEFQATDLTRIKEFYGAAFGWAFTDWGETYISFEGAGLSGGFEQVAAVGKGGPLIVLYHADLETVLQNVRDAGGTITKEIFSFPGGKRFQFEDPNGNELAVWTTINDTE